MIELQIYNVLAPIPLPVFTSHHQNPQISSQYLACLKGRNFFFFPLRTVIFNTVSEMVSCLSLYLLSTSRSCPVWTLPLTIIIIVPFLFFAALSYCGKLPTKNRFFLLHSYYRWILFSYNVSLYYSNKCDHSISDLSLWLISLTIILSIPIQVSVNFIISSFPL